MEKIKVIIPTLGRSGLAKTLRDIMKDFELSGIYEVEVLVISDGTDAFGVNKKIIAEMDKPVHSNFSINHFQNSGIGVSTALNFGLAKVLPNEFFMIFTDDDEWIPGRLTILIEAILSNKSVKSCLPQIIL